MAFIDDLRRIYRKELDAYVEKIMIRDETIHPEYEFETFDEWLKERGYARE